MWPRVPTYMQKVSAGASTCLLSCISNMQRQSRPPPPPPQQAQGGGTAALHFAAQRRPLVAHVPQPAAAGDLTMDCVSQELAWSLSGTGNSSTWAGCGWGGGGMTSWVRHGGPSRQPEPAWAAVQRWPGSGCALYTCGGTA